MGQVSQVTGQCWEYRDTELCPAFRLYVSGTSASLYYTSQYEILSTISTSNTALYSVLLDLFIGYLKEAKKILCHTRTRGVVPELEANPTF